ncbi:MAG: dipeptide epimerase [Elusimicrobia bacterium]|nr:dipeptide epimerase [Elusimicrobiota bacterium]
MPPRRPKPTVLVRLRAKTLDVPLSEPFSIATATRTEASNVLVEAVLADGSRGFGECAPLSGFTTETQASALKSARGAAEFLEGQDAAAWERVCSIVEERLSDHPSVRAGIEMAVLDAWARSRGIPLWRFFGGAESSVRTDVTVTIVPPDAAARAARRILALGISTIKIKVGKDMDEDVRRVVAVAEEAPNADLIVDANQGYDAALALRFLGELKRAGITPALYEQPVPRDDWDGMAKVSRDGKVPVAADETVSGRADALRMAKTKAAAVVNIKFMKCGIREAWDIARISRGAGLKLMMGGMIESRLSMTCAAHFAAGIGAFSFVDLDTPLWFSRDPMQGVSMGSGGLYDLSSVRAGIGVAPKRAS